ncbi:MAG: helix-turn-helix transcriptional regulator [Planctomycetales bacterium]|nr:helix-turn-helix transcriptional regulator [Planctomycetales bacterium]
MTKNRQESEQTALLTTLRRIRREAGVTQEALARKLGQPQSFVSKYEAGERRLDILEVRQVCHALGLSLFEFVKRFEESLRP